MFRLNSAEYQSVYFCAPKFQGVLRFAPLIDQVSNLPAVVDGQCGLDVATEFALTEYIPGVKSVLKSVAVSIIVPFDNGYNLLFYALFVEKFPVLPDCDHCVVRDAKAHSVPLYKDCVSVSGMDAVFHNIKLVYHAPLKVT